MIQHGYYNILTEAFSQVEYPVIILNPDFSVKYINKQAEILFCHFFKSALWTTKFFDDEALETVRSCVSRGEYVLITQPNIKTFASALFQPIINGDGEVEAIKLNLELFPAKKTLFAELGNSNCVYDTLISGINGTLSAMHIVMHRIRDSSNITEIKAFINLLENSVTLMNSYVSNSEYLLELIYRHNIKTDTLLRPGKVLEEEASQYKNVITKLPQGYETAIVFDNAALRLAINTIVSHMKIYAGDNPVFITEKQADYHIVFSFKAKMQCEDLINKEILKQNKLRMNVLKKTSLRQGGHLCTIFQGDSIRILYSLSIKQQADHTMTLRQEGCEIDAFSGTQRSKYRIPGKFFSSL